MPCLVDPPCRTVSKLRHQRPGPPVLRARHGPERFALDCLSEADRELALNDATLWFRQLWLFSLAQGARKEKVRFLKEHPRDPQEYKAKSDSTDYPSFFAWPEWASFKKKFDIKGVKLDLGAHYFGYEHQSPRPSGWKNVMNIPLEQKVKETRSWAAWPEPFKLKIVEGLRLELEHPVVSKMSSEDWARHRALDHMPFNRECPECQKGAGRSRPHKRIRAGHVYAFPGFVRAIPPWEGYGGGKEPLHDGGSLHNPRRQEKQRAGSFGARVGGDPC